MNVSVRSALLLGIALAALTGVVGCHPQFDPKIYANNPTALFAASLKQLNGKNYDDAAKGFEQLTRDLPARDPLLPSSYYYLGEAQERNGDHLLAAQSYGRIAESFPDDSLAPRALLESGLSYRRMWRNPQLDATYGASAENSFQQLVALYPDSPLVLQATKQMAALDNMFAEKDLETADHYLRRGAYDSAIIYYKDVARLHPNAPATRLAYLHLLQAYRAIKYTADARDVCHTMAKAYPNDKEVRGQCGSVSSAAASTPRT